jgi:hypothetical protein
MIQAATEQAARALALYAREAQELRDQLAQAQAQLESRGSGTFASSLKSARRSLIRRDNSSAALDQVSDPTLPKHLVQSTGIMRYISRLCHLINYSCGHSVP